MKDFVFMKSVSINPSRDDIKNGVRPIFAFAIDDYAALSGQYLIPEKIDIAGIILDSSDSKESVQAFVQFICTSTTSIFVFGFDENDEADMDAVNWIKEAFHGSVYKELENVYEDRIVFAKDHAMAMGLFMKKGELNE